MTSATLEWAFATIVFSSSAAVGVSIGHQPETVTGAHSAPVFLLAAASLTVTLILFGDDIARRIKVRRGRQNVARHGIHRSREAMLPLCMIGGLWASGEVTSKDAISALAKADIIVLIFAFAIIAHGIGQCGYFRHLAMQWLQASRGNTTGLVLGLFVMSSVATVVTSNDVVILTMTPIVLEIARRAEIPNPKTLLISQYIAANTASMGLLTGSPTNVIVAQTTGMDFASYAQLMMLPTLGACIASLAVLYIMMALTQNHVPRFKCSPRHTPAAVRYAGQLDRAMIGWVSGFVALIGAVAALSHYGLRHRSKCGNSSLHTRAGLSRGTQCSGSGGVQ